MQSGTTMGSEVQSGTTMTSEGEVHKNLEPWFNSKQKLFGNNRLSLLTKTFRKPWLIGDNC